MSGFLLDIRLEVSLSGISPVSQFKYFLIFKSPMESTSHEVKRADSAAGGTAVGQVDGSRGDLFMSHKCFNGEQIGPVFVKVGTESVVERMAGDTPGPAQMAFMLMDVSGEEESVNGLIPSGLLREKIPPWTAIGEPVESEDIQGVL